MANELYFGGLLKVEIDVEGGPFSSPLITITEFTREGQTIPQPQAVTDGLSNDQEGPTGEKTSFAFNGINLDPTKVDTVRAKGFTLDALDVRFHSKDGVKTMTLIGCIVRVATSAINEFGKYGFVKFEGESVSAGSAKSYTLT